MPSDPVELTKQVKAASDIVAVVGSYINVTPAGKIFKAVCPFHNDTRPSLDVDPARQRYRCWSCGAHGDVFAFVQNHEKVGFKEARQILADKAGIKLDEQQTPQDYQRTRLLEVMRWAQSKYAYQYLEADAGEAARKYMGERKLTGKTVREFGIGFAPITGDWLARLAAAEGISEDVLVEVGLTAVREGNRGHYDRFRDRVMFPIKDVRGQVVGFGGRIMPTNPLAARGPKYYNSAETPLFHKSELLYGLDLARHANAGYLAVVEGYTDVMMAHQCGIPQVVATMGTALNAKHVAQLRRYAPKVVLLYDADAGGYTGVDRALEMFVSQDVELAVATLPEGLDPCDLLVRPDGIDTFKQVLTSAVDALDFKLNKLLERNPKPSDATKLSIVDDVLSIMATAPPIPGASAQMKRELIVTRLLQRLGLKSEKQERLVWSRFAELRKAHEQKERERQQKEREQKARENRGAVASDATLPTNERTRGGQKAGPAAAAEKQLAQLLLGDPNLVPVAAAQVTPEEITHTGLRRLLTELYAAEAEGTVPDLETLRERLRDRPDLFDTAQTLQFVGQQMQDREQWLARLLKRFADMRADDEAKKAKDLLAGASDEETMELLKRIQQAQAPKRSAG